MKLERMFWHLMFQSARSESTNFMRPNRVKKTLRLGVFPWKTRVFRRFENVGKHIAKTCLLPALFDVQRTSKSSVHCVDLPQYVARCQCSETRFLTRSQS
jgi:hypothetical protein